MFPDTTSRAHRLRRSIAAIGMVGATLLVLVACSDDDAGSGTTPSEATAGTTSGPGSEVAATTDAPADGELWTGVAPNMAPVDDATAAKWRTLFEGALTQAAGVPGAWVAVSDPALGYWEAAIGDAVVEPTQPATIDDHGRIGSITKTFTATAVLEQVDQGDLSLEDTVAEITPDLAEEFPATADLTVEQLLGMESGLGDYANVPGAATAQAVADPTKVWTAEELIAAALDASPVQPVGTPGYSTTNYAILGRMLEAVTGEPVEDIVTDLAERAGLDETALLPGVQNDMPDPSTHGYIDAAGVPGLAEVGATVVEGTDVTEWSISWGGAGGGMYSVIRELFMWTSTAMGTNLLSADLAEQRLTFDTVIADAGIEYGLGLFQLLVAEGWVGHTGQAIGWEALGFYNIETGATIAVMMNGTSGMGPFYGAWTQIFDVMNG